MKFKKYITVFLLGCFAFLILFSMYGNTVETVAKAASTVAKEAAKKVADPVVIKAAGTAIKATGKKAAEETPKLTLISAIVNSYKWSKKFIDENPKTAFALGIVGTTGIFLCEKWCSQYMANKEKLLRALNADNREKGDKNKLLALDLAKRCYLFFPTKVLENKINEFYSNQGIARDEALSNIRTYLMLWTYLY